MSVSLVYLDNILVHSSYYKQFVPSLHILQHYCLYWLVENKGSCGVKSWTSFHYLKMALLSQPVLGYLEPENHFIVDTDASSERIGAVVTKVQRGEESDSHKRSAERWHCLTQKELLAIVWAIHHFYTYFMDNLLQLRPIVLLCGGLWGFVIQKDSCSARSKEYRCMNLLTSTGQEWVTKMQMHFQRICVFKMKKARLSTRNAPLLQRMTNSILSSWIFAC